MADHMIATKRWDNQKGNVFADKAMRPASSIAA
jgi:hypothetical protein